MKSLLLALALTTTTLAQGPTQKPRRPIGVPADAQWFNGHWFKVYLEKKTWHAARDKCREFGGHLAIIPDAETWAFVKGLGGPVSVWLGATDEAVEGAWKWVDGTIVTFSAWIGAGPDNSRGVEHYLATYKAEWNDAPKTGEFIPHQFVRGYICEWK